MKDREVEPFAVFKNQDFGILERIDEENDRVLVRQAHGTICLVKIEQSDGWDLVPFGIEDGDETHTAKIAFWKPYDEIEKIAKGAGICDSEN